MKKFKIAPWFWKQVKSQGAFIFCAGIVAGCAAFSSQSTFIARANDIAGQNQFSREVIAAAPFHLVTFSKIETLGNELVVYVEGDGFAYRANRMPSTDPTPQHLLTLTLAGIDSHSNVAYIARPCQYESLHLDQACQTNKYWTGGRFALEVIQSMQQVLDQLKQKAKAQKIHLVGYSGGGAMVLLSAAGRNDIASIRTIAGNVDPRLQSNILGVSELKKSLNPIDYVSQLRLIPQIHYVGEKDQIVSKQLAEHFLEKLSSQCADIQVVPKASHDQGWLEIWSGLNSKIPEC